MNAKNKAKEIISKYFTIGSLTWCEAIECAFISVDEVLMNLPDLDEKYDYWHEVKNEILKIQKSEIANGNIYFNKPDHIVNKQLELF